RCCGCVWVEGGASAASPADILVEAGRIAAILPAGASEGARAADIPDARILDASEHVVCPGFICIHSHDELIHALPLAEQRPLMTGRLLQGITTEIVGNCGT